MRIIQTADLTPTTRLTPDEKAWTYNGLDVCVTMEVLEATLPQLDNTTSATYDFSRSLQAPVLEMSMRGMLVDRARTAEVIKEFEENTARLEKQFERIVFALCGKFVKWSSPKQIGILLYDVMGLPEQRKRNKYGRMARTTGRDALEKLRNEYFLADPICSHILKLRDVAKKLQFLHTEIDSDNRIRTTLNIAGTNTGRLSSSSSAFGTGSNLQNIERTLRSTIIADKGMKFANLDLEQADARNVGAICWNLFHASDGPDFAGAYLDACESGDLHTRVCEMGWRELDWSSGDKRAVAEEIAYRDMSYRDLAKRLGHGSNYYGTPRTMAKHTKVDTKVIKRFQDKYFSSFPCIRKWHKRVAEELEQYGFITTLLGRRRFFFGRTNEDATLREAIAYEPQSLTADQIDTGLIRLWRLGRVQVLMQVHDSILFQYREEEEDEIIPLALEALKVEIPLIEGRSFHVPVEAKIGWNWGDVKTDKQGNVIDNPSGLVKWKGPGLDTRTRPALRRVSLRDL